MSNLTCHSKKVLKSSDSWKQNFGKRPKGLTDEEWAAIVKEDRLNKLIVLNKVPKVSRKTSNTRE